MKNSSKLINWIGVAIFAILTVVALLKGSILAALLFLLGGVVIAPIRIIETVLQKLKLNKVVAIILAVALLLTGTLTLFIPERQSDPDDSQISGSITDGTSGTNETTLGTTDNSTEGQETTTDPTGDTTEATTDTTEDTEETTEDTKDTTGDATEATTGNQSSSHNHSYTSKVTAPTCTEKGYTTYTCACGNTYKANETAAKGHTYSDATCTKAQTCSCGAEKGSALGHKYTVQGVCARCGAADPNYSDARPGDPDFEWKITTTTGDLLGWSGFETDEQAIRGLYDAGFRYIDFSMYSNITKDSVYMSSKWREEARKLKAVADELGMTFVQAHAPGGNLLSTNQSEVNFLMESTKRSIEICEVLGIKNIVVHVGWRDGINRQEWMRLNKEMYNKLLPTAEKCGVNILCENSTVKNMRDFHYLSTGAEMREFVKYVDHPYFHACWDTGHAHCDGLDQYKEIVALGDEMYAIHYAENAGNGDTHLMPFFGSVDHDSIMRGLIEIGFNGPFVLECDGSPRTSNVYTGPAFAWVKEAVKNSKDPTSPTVLKKLNRAQQEKLLFDIANYIVTEYPKNKS